MFDRIKKAIWRRKIYRLVKSLRVDQMTKQLAGQSASSKHIKVNEYSTDIHISGLYIYISNKLGIDFRGWSERVSIHTTKPTYLILELVPREAYPCIYSVLELSVEQLQAEISAILREVKKRKERDTERLVSYWKAVSWLQFWGIPESDISRCIDIYMRDA